MAKGKTTTFANRPLKRSTKSEVAIAEQTDDASLPARLPTVSLDAVGDLADGCLLSLLVVTKTQGAAIEGETSVGKKLVCNCDVMAGGPNIAFAAWGDLAAFMRQRCAATLCWRSHRMTGSA